MAATNTDQMDYTITPSQPTVLDLISVGSGEVGGRRASNCTPTTVATANVGVFKAAPSCSEDTRAPSEIPSEAESGKSGDPSPIDSQQYPVSNWPIQPPQSSPSTSSTCSLSSQFERQKLSENPRHQSRKSIDLSGNSNEHQSSVSSEDSLITRFTHHTLAENSSDLTPLMSHLSHVTTKKQLTQAIEETVSMIPIYNGDIQEFVEIITKRPGCALSVTRHDEHIRFVHPLSRKEVSLLSNKNSVRTAGARFRKALNEVTKLEEEIQERVHKREQCLESCINLELERRVYNLYEDEEAKLQDSTFKVDLSIKKAQLRREMQDAMKAKIAEFAQKSIAGKRCRDEDEDDEEPEENEEDRRFRASEREPKKYKPASAHDSVKVTCVDQSNEWVISNIRLSDPIAVLYSKLIELDPSMRPNSFSLTHRGQPLQGEYTLHQCCISDGDIVRIVPEN